MKRKIFAIITLLILTLSTAVVLTGCGGDKKNVLIYDGESLIAASELKVGESFEADVLKKAGYEFLGYYLDKGFENRITNEKGLSLSSFDGSFTALYAQYRALDVLITLNAAGGKLSDNDLNRHYVKYGETIGESLPVPSKNGYDFIGWQGKLNKIITDSAGLVKEENIQVNYDTYDIIESDMSVTLTAVYSLKKITISFNTFGGTSVNELTTEMFSSVPELPGTMRSGYYFAGWKLSESDKETIKLPLKITINMPEKLELFACFILSEEANSLIYSEFNNGQGYEVSYFSDTATKLIIPDMFSGKPVLRIKKIAVPKLEKILIPSSVTAIAPEAFLGCAGLKSVSVPSSVKNIGDGAFMDNGSLTHVYLSEGLTSIGAGAFKNCVLLQEINLPSSLTELKKGALNGTKDGLNIILPQSGSQFKFESGLLYKNNGGELTALHASNHSPEVITLDIATREIGAEAFSGLTKVKTIKTEGLIRRIGAEAFSGMTGLINLSLTGDTIIETGAFKNCVSLKALSLSSQIPREVGEDVFLNCSDFLSVFVPDASVKAYREDTRWSVYSNRIYAVSDNHNGFILKKINTSVTQESFEVVNYVGTEEDIVIPSVVDGRKVISISNAFIGMSDIKTVSLSENITSIGEKAFYGCVSLKWVYFKSSNPPSIHASAFENTNDSYIMYTINDITVYDAFFNSPAFYPYAILNRLKTL